MDIGYALAIAFWVIYFGVLLVGGLFYDRIFPHLPKPVQEELSIMGGLMVTPPSIVWDAIYSEAIKQFKDRK